MLNTRPFSDILADLETAETLTMADSTIHHPPHRTDYFESHLDLFGLGDVIQIMTKTPRTTSFKIGIQKAYPFKQQTSRQTNSANPCPTHPIHTARPTHTARPSHKLNELQLKALHVLKCHSTQLQDNFNLHELKSAYRLSVLKTHPDQGGNSESFHEVKKSYHILLVLVKN